MSKEKEEGYLTVETAFWMPGLAVLAAAMVFLCSYLYQGCFLSQNAYLAAFRASRVRQLTLREAHVKKELASLAEWQILSFGETKQEVETGMAGVTVTLSRKTPLLKADGTALMLVRKKTAICLDPVDYIRGLQVLDKAGEIQK